VTIDTSVPSVGASAGPAPQGEPIQLSWRAPPGLLGLSVVNYVLRILTLGIYHFWGKTEVRKRIWNAIRLNGEPLEYTGTGKELLVGFLVVFGLVLIPATLGSFAVMAVFGPESALLGIYQMLIYAGFFFLTGVGIYRAQRYRFSRTRWRGIRGGLDEASWSYGWTYIWTAALIPVTFGWIVPWRATRLQSLVTNRMRFGSKPLTFSASSRPLYARYAVLWLGSIAILGAAGGLIGAWSETFARRGQLGPGITPSPAYVAGVLVTLALGYVLYAVVSAWYRASQINHFALHTHFDRATFRGNATAGSLIWLSVTNFLLVIFTLGVLAPIAQARSARYLAERLAIDGSVSLKEIEQAPDSGISRGEGLAQAFDIDAF